MIGKSTGEIRRKNHKKKVKDVIKNLAGRIEKLLLTGYHVIIVIGESILLLLRHNEIVIGKDKVIFSRYKKRDIIELLKITSF